MYCGRRRVGAITYLGISPCSRVLAAYVRSQLHHVPSRNIHSREFPVEPLAEPARSSVFKTRLRCRLFGLPHVQPFEVLLDAPLRNDMGLVCE